MGTDAKPEAGTTAWAVQWHSRNRADGLDQHWMWDGTGPLLFHTRRDARAFIKSNYGYIAERPDLREEPHGWQAPRAVKVSVILEEFR